MTLILPDFVLGTLLPYPIVVMALKKSSSNVIIQLDDIVLSINIDLNSRYYGRDCGKDLNSESFGEFGENNQDSFGELEEK